MIVSLKYRQIGRHKGYRFPSQSIHSLFSEERENLENRNKKTNYPRFFLGNAQELSLDNLYATIPAASPDDFTSIPFPHFAETHIMRIRVATDRDVSSQSKRHSNPAEQLLVHGDDPYWPRGRTPVSCKMDVCSSPKNQSQL